MGGHKPAQWPRAPKGALASMAQFFDRDEVEKYKIIKSNLVHGGLRRMVRQQFAKL